MKKFAAIIACAVVAFILLPDTAYAWGPGVHLSIAEWLFSNLSVLPSSVAQTIAMHKDAFRYGALSADIFIGKGCTVVPGHSHNWETGFTLLRNVDTPELQAYAYGYLSHLAADIVAHNTYVPTLMSGAPTAGKLGHVYIEAQADRLVRWDNTNVKGMFSLSCTAHDDQLLCATRKDKNGFAIRKQVFRSSIAVCSNTAWKQSLKLLHTAIPGAADKKFLSSMLNASLTSVIDILSQKDESTIAAADPIGEHALADSKGMCAGTSLFSYRNPFPLVFPLAPSVAALPQINAASAIMV
ncbi:MAG: zinc dependent phospholipase C family protein [Desulfovibrionales bacterium]|nr:zinc dependent phospholipase C family protein [Desulfovibrionales bacterium]